MKFCILFVSQTGNMKRFCCKLFSAIPAASTCPISSGIVYTIDIWSYSTELVIPGLINRPLSVILRSRATSTMSCTCTSARLPQRNYFNQSQITSKSLVNWSVAYGSWHTEELVCSCGVNRFKKQRKSLRNWSMMCVSWHTEEYSMHIGSYNQMILVCSQR